MDSVVMVTAIFGVALTKPIRKGKTFRGAANHGDAVQGSEDREIHRNRAARPCTMES